jgi:large subunit ribosomal protein L31
MKKESHPKYQQVLFEDTSTGVRFICGSTLQPKESTTHEGKEYPIYRVSVSSASHPLFTGSSGLVDAEGRVDKFRKRYAKAAAPATPAVSAPADKQGEEKKAKTPAKPKAAKK